MAWSSTDNWTFPVHPARRLQVTKLFDVGPLNASWVKHHKLVKVHNRALSRQNSSLQILDSSGFVTAVEGLADLLVLNPSTGSIPRCPAPSI